MIVGLRYQCDKPGCKNAISLRAEQDIEDFGWAKRQKHRKGDLEPTLKHFCSKHHPKKEGIINDHNHQG